MANSITIVILGALVVIGIWFVARWFVLERRGRVQPGDAKSLLTIPDTLIGFVVNFFDTLGVSSFASTTAAFKLLRRMPDEQIPGTLNVGHALPTIAQALIFIAIVTVEPMTLLGMIVAATAGAWLGVGFASRLPRRAIQITMGLALLVAAALFVAGLRGWMPSGGDALGLHGVTLAFAIGVSFALGVLMMLGVGFYAPCLILVSLLGMNPLAAFPIMMGACAFLMPVGGARFVESGRYSLRSAVGLSLGGVPGVLIAAYIVKSLPIDWLRWMVVVVVTYAAISMLLSAWRDARAPAGPSQD